MRVAVDAMGGDHAPREQVAGSLLALSRDPKLEIMLVGRQADLEAELSTQGASMDRLELVFATDVIGMNEKPVEALKSKPDSSIGRAVLLVRGGHAEGLIAAGSTGAAVAAAGFGLKRLEGVRRPGIAVPMPALNKSGVCLLIDAGANPSCRPHHLEQYGVMGANYFREIFECASPRVAVVSIGEEEAKGNELTREATKLLRQGELNFVGNIEGRGLFGGDCEVAVADGFVGNIILKASQGCAEMILGKIHQRIGKEQPELMRELFGMTDYAEFGGAPLLGVDGHVMICHGRSDRRAIANAIRACTRAVQQNVKESIVAGLARTAARGASSA